MGQPGRQLGPSSAVVTGWTVAEGVVCGRGLVGDVSMDGDDVAAGGDGAGGGDAAPHCTRTTLTSASVIMRQVPVSEPPHRALSNIVINW